MALVGLVCTVVGVLLGILTFGRNRDKDIRQDAADAATIRTKLDHISSGVDSIRVDFKATVQRVEDLTERVTRVEESAKQAHKRLDNMGERRTAE
ncbi:hypothetical protein BTO30_13405 [Domibacillus antri]|uniref:Uncharacterized protein n=1 Tax=Domibacillus antri TaxID=1714264 RepID=A0A1Q8Q335_9BACI|nr:hypothetical protein BTO30_13405 [Domibacillus antri]